jgi:hypothetical protein
VIGDQNRVDLLELGDEQTVRDVFEMHSARLGAVLSHVD